MSKIDEIKNEQENDKRTDDTINRTNNAIKGTALVAAGIPTAYVSKDYLLGKKNAYHVTTLDNWNDDIRRSGLKYVKGGGGLAAKNDFSADRRNRYIYNSLNNVHATSNKNFAKRLADYYERQGEDSKLLKLKINYNKYKNNMRVDPDSLVPNGGNFFYNNDTKFGRHNLKNFGAKGEVDISPEEIVGSDAKLGSRIKNTALNLPGYIKENPLRFAAGTALAAGGTYATYKGIQKLKKSRNKNREEEKENMSKAAYDYIDMIEKVAFDKNKYFTNSSIERYISENDPKSVKRSLGAICYTIDLDNGNFDKALNYIENKRGMKIKEKFNSEFPLVYSNDKKDYSGRDLGLAIAQMQENFSPERIDDVKKISKAIDEKNKRESLKQSWNYIKNNMPKKNKNLALAGAVAVPLAAAGIGYGLYRYNKKKKQEEENMNKSASYYVNEIEKVAFDKNKYFTNSSIERNLLENDLMGVKLALGSICYTIDLGNGNFDKALNYVENKRGMKIKEKFNPKFPLIYSDDKKDYRGRDLGLAVSYMQQNFSPERIDDVKKVYQAVSEKNKRESLKQSWNYIKNNMPKKNKNLALAGAVAVPLTAATAYGIYRHNKKKKENYEA